MMNHALACHYYGDEIDMKVMRKPPGKDLAEEMSISVTLEPVEWLVPVHQYDKETSYFVHAGLVFVPLTYPYLYEWGMDWYSHAPRKLCERAAESFPDSPGQQVVVLSHILMDKVNYGYESVSPAEVIKFNGEDVKSLAHLKIMIENCETDFLEFEVAHPAGWVVVLDRLEADEAQGRILEKYAIPQAASDNLIHTE